MVNRDKEIIKMMAEKGVNLDDLSERLNDFPEPSSAKDIEDKLAKLINPQPLFTLTAEEVEIVEYLAEWGRTAVKAGIGFGFMPSIDEIKRLEKIDNLLTRIKQWKDDNIN